MTSLKDSPSIGLLENAVECSLNNKLLMILLFAIVGVLGLWRLLQLPIDAFPDTTPIQVQINTLAP